MECGGRGEIDTYDKIIIEFLKYAVLMHASRMCEILSGAEVACTLEEGLFFLCIFSLCTSLTVSSISLRPFRCFTLRRREIHGHVRRVGDGAHAQTDTQTHTQRQCECESIW